MVEYKFKVKHKILRTGEVKECICVVNFKRKIENSADAYAACIARISSELYTELDMDRIEIESITLCGKRECEARSLFSFYNLKNICEWGVNPSSLGINLVSDRYIGDTCCQVYVADDNIPVYYEKYFHVLDPIEREKFIDNDNHKPPYAVRGYRLYVGRYQVEWYKYVGSGCDDTPETSLWDIYFFNESHKYYDTRIELNIREVENILLSEYNMLSNLNHEDELYKKISGYSKIYFTNIGLLK